MSRPQAVATDAAPAAIGPYSQAVVADRLVFVSGQLGLDPATGALVPGGVAAEARQALANLRAVLAAAGSGPELALKVTIYLVDMQDFATVNAAYAEVFRAPFPARACVAVAALPKGGRVEIDAVAARS